MFTLDNEFIDSISDSSCTVTIGGRTIVLRHTTAMQGANEAEIEVLEISGGSTDRSILGYITIFPERSRGGFVALTRATAKSKKFNNPDDALRAILKPIQQ